jgi:hypothetical protein
MPAVKLSKTERSMLTEASKSEDGTITAIAAWNTARPHLNPGVRYIAAVTNLIKKGLACNLRVEMNQLKNHRDSGVTHYREYQATITDRGRELASQITARRMASHCYKQRYGAGRNHLTNPQFFCPPKTMNSS